MKTSTRTNSKKKIIKKMKAKLAERSKAVNRQASIQRSFFKASDGKPLLTQLLGHAPEPLEDFHGLSGRLSQDVKPSNPYGYNRDYANFHMDGNYDGVSPPPPAVVAMYCEEASLQGGLSALGQ